MAYKVYPKHPIRDVSDCRWFGNSYDTIGELDFKDVEDSDREYEQKFGVKLIYGKPEDPKGVYPILAVEFPSEEDATLFLLRWG
jgi:hypothetical protein